MCVDRRAKGLTLAVCRIGAQPPIRHLNYIKSPERRQPAQVKDSGHARWTRTGSGPCCRRRAGHLKTPDKAGVEAAGLEVCIGQDALVQRN